MLKVKLTTSSQQWPLARQTPGANGIWGDCIFYINQDVEDCDFWVVYDDLPAPETCFCPPKNTILFTAEPPSVKRYYPNYARQFGMVVTCQHHLKHPNAIYHQQALFWHVGRCQRNHQNLSWSKDYDELSGIKSFQKDRLISVITSDKAFTPGHRKRLEFVQDLVSYFGSDLDVYGRGINEIEDKWDAIAPYKYHVVLENGEYPDYWTEKLSDTYLAGAFPFYNGCPNLPDYFQEGSFIQIPLDARQASQKIKQAIHNKLYDRSIDQISVARELVLNRYNLFAEIDSLCNHAPPTEPGKLITLCPMAFFRRSRFARQVVGKIKHFLKYRDR